MGALYSELKDRPPRQKGNASELSAQLSKEGFAESLERPAGSLWPLADAKKMPVGGAMCPHTNNVAIKNH